MHYFRETALLKYILLVPVSEEKRRIITQEVTKQFIYLSDNAAGFV